MFVRQRHPTSRKRVAQLNEDVDVLREQRPDLAIIGRPTWDAVQVLVDEHPKKYKSRGLLWEGVFHVSFRGGATRAVYRDIIGV